MRILIDTNIFIHRENYHIVPENLQQLLKALSFLKAEIVVHPESIEELRKDPDEIRKGIDLSKISTYPKLESPPNAIDDVAFLQGVGVPSNAHDKVDNALIYAVYRDAVDFLISEDKRITSKASKVNLRNRVLSVDEAVERARAKETPILEQGFRWN